MAEQRSKQLPKFELCQHGVPKEIECWQCYKKTDEYKRHTNSENKTVKKYDS